MSDMPDDVMKTALEAVLAWVKRSDDPTVAHCVARAILAERERCAKIAEDMGQWRDVPASERWDEDLECWFPVAASRVRVVHGGKHIAAAIRDGSQP